MLKRTLFPLAMCFGLARRLAEVRMKMPLWTWLVPVLALCAFLMALAIGVRLWLAWLCGAALAGTVFVAVHHAEVVAHRVGEPFGTLVLALAGVRCLIARSSKCGSDQGQIVCACSAKAFRHRGRAFTNLARSRFLTRFAALLLRGIRC